MLLVYWGSHAHYLFVVFSDFAVLGGLGVLQTEKKFVSDSQISSEMVLAKKL